MPVAPRHHLNGFAGFASVVAGSTARPSYLPVPGGKEHDRDSHGSRVRRVFRGACGAAEKYLTDYMVLPEQSGAVIAAWVAAAWLQDQWDKFPHLAVTSPEKRCGKTTLLDLLHQIVPRSRYTTNISPAALYRVIEKERPTLLMDESQSISRRGSEASEVIREILNAGIGKNAKVVRCGGQRMDEIQEFATYSPKVFAMIGEPDSVLADRCLPVALRRKTKADEVRRYRSREVEEVGAKVKAELEQWAIDNAEKVKEAYDRLEPFAIENDRMADLLMPLQAVVAVADLDGSGGLAGVLREYAESLDERDREADRQDPGVRLLVACQEIFTETAKATKCPSVLGVFLPTELLLLELKARTEEPWATYTRGLPITPEALAKLLRQYGIRSERNRDQSARGYVGARFKDAWDRYLACPSGTPPIPPTPDTPVSPILATPPNGKGGGPCP